MTETDQKYIADVMLGRLARWLRLLGYDVKYYSSLDDNKLLYIALTENRILLTRDRELAIRGGKHAVLLESDKVLPQLKEMVEKQNIDLTLSFRRCSICNKTIEPISKEKVEGKIPTYTFRTHQEFYSCPECGRIYWEGSHKKLIHDFLQLETE